MIVVLRTDEDWRGPNRYSMDALVQLANAFELHHEYPSSARYWYVGNVYSSKHTVHSDLYQAIKSAPAFNEELG